MCRSLGRRMPQWGRRSPLGRGIEAGREVALLVRRWRPSDRDALGGGLQSRVCRTGVPRAHVLREALACIVAKRSQNIERLVDWHQHFNSNRFLARR